MTPFTALGGTMAVGKRSPELEASSATNGTPLEDESWYADVENDCVGEITCTPMLWVPRTPSAQLRRPSAGWLH
jgi:hypothetical protein